MTIADQITEKSRQLFPNDRGHSRAPALVLHQAESTQARLVISDKGSQAVAMYSSNTLAVANDRFDIHSDLLRYCRQGDALLRLPGDRHILFSPEARPRTDAHAVVDGYLIQSPPASIRQQETMSEGAFQLETAPRPDPNSLPILKFCPIINTACILTVAYLHAQPLIYNFLDP